MTTGNEIKKESGIYKIINKVNGKYYVGSTNNFKNRWRQHRQSFKQKNHSNKYLQRSWYKYKENNFEFIIVKKCPIEELLTEEQNYLNIALTEKNNCYNETFIAGKVEMTNEIRKKISNSNKGKIQSEETKQKLREISLKQFENGMPEETRIKIGNACRGIKSPFHDKEVYEFQNIVTNEIFKGLRCEFYQKYNLSRGKIHALIHGLDKTHKGWRLKSFIDNNPEFDKLKYKPNYDKTIYTFLNTKTNETFTGIRFDFCKKYGFRDVSRLVKKQRKSYKDWILIK